MRSALVAWSALMIGTAAHAQMPDFNKLKDQMKQTVDGIKPKDPAAPATPVPAPTTANVPAAPTAAAPRLGTGPVTGTLAGQGAEMTTCEKMARVPGSQWDVQCDKPTKTFAYKGA